MSSLPEVVARCDDIGRRLRGHGLTRHQLLEVATALMLIADYLNRAMNDLEVHGAVQGYVMDPMTADIAAAMSALQLMREDAQTAPIADLHGRALAAQAHLVAAGRHSQGEGLHPDAG